MTTPDDNEDFASLLAEFESETGGAPRARGPRVGDVVTGRVVNIGAEAVFVELGGKSEGVLDRDQVTDQNGELRVAIGDRVEARVVDTSGGTIVLRTGVSRGPDAHAELAQAFEHRLPVEGVVSAVNKGGLEITLAGVRAFCPVSQISNQFVEDPASFVGQKLTFQITRMEPGRGKTPNIVVSRRVLLEQEAERQAAETRKVLEPGAVLRGTVTRLKEYGAFVDLGGIEGMLHISELAFGRVEHPGEVLREGQTVEVCVLRIEKTGDPKRPEKVALSLKALEKDPWDEAADAFPEGARVKGTVVRLQPFGAFVELAPGVEGLVHISELGAGRRINHPREVVSEGQAIEVAVLAVDREKRRISLSIGALAAAEEAADAAAYRPAPSRSLGTFADLLKPKK